MSRVLAAARRWFTLGRFARFIPDGTIRVMFVAAIADTSAPTVAELGAGVNITPFVKRGGLSTPSSANLADDSDLSSKYNKTGRGTYGGQPITLNMYRDNATDTAWSTFPDGTTGHIVIGRFGGSGAAGVFAATDDVEVWPIEVASREMDDAASNERTSFTVTCAVPAEPEMDAVVAA